MVELEATFYITREATLLSNAATVVAVPALIYMPGIGLGAKMRVFNIG